MKVFEFAKEIGIETISLMDKIREWKLPIKSHMATLDGEMIDAIKDRLREESSAKSSATKGKGAAKKKTAAKLDEKAASVKTAKASDKDTVVKAKKAVVVKAEKTEKKVSKSKAPEAVTKKAQEVEAANTIVNKTAPSGVIRRKAGEIAAAQKAAADAAALQATEDAAIEAEERAAAALNPDSNSTPGAAATSATPGKVEVKRRNIIGRMDLSRARGPASASGTGTSTGSSATGATGAAGDRTRPSATSSRNIRTGFFATPNDDAALREAEEEKKREEKKKRPAAAKDEEVQAFIASDFRKREVIFQPKKKKVALRGEVRKTQITTPKASKRIIKVEKAMTVNALAQALGVKVALLMRKLMTEGITANINTELDFDTIALLVPEFNFEAQNVYQSSDTLLDNAAFGELEAELITRAPVVTVMGHVDHGKTSLLDAIRSANVADKEAGGITQHIGAYKVKVDGGKEITFLDTPGHEAFTQMRARGANVTDIVIVVVAADDGVMPQTAEAINHAKAAGVPIIIAVNKIDKPGINVDRIKQQLTEFQIVPEEWGGTNIFCEVSAVKKIGIKELLSQILLVAEVEDLKANLKRSGTGVIIESSVAKGRGPVATLLIQDGTVRTGDNIVVGTISGRIRAMMNDRGEQVREAHAGDPVEIIGLSESVSASDRFDVVKDEETAKRIADIRKQESIKPVATGKNSMTLEELFSKVQAGKVLELNVVLKADVSGSMEALQGMLEKAGTSEVKVKVIHSHIGGINESDVLLAATSGGVVIGFNVRPDTAAIRTAKERHVEIKCYTIIYELIDDVKKAMGGLLKPTLKETIHGRANVREVFSVPKIGNIAGCSVSDGKITRSDLCRLLRNGTIIYQGKFSSLKRFKDDVREVATGFECGIGIENFNDIKAGDVIEAYIIEEIAREL